MAAALLHARAGLAAARHTALARRYNVTTAEIDAAIELLADSHLLPGCLTADLPGQPGRYRLVLEGLTGFATQVDPMGGQMVCRPQRFQAAARGRRRTGARRAGRP